MRTMSAALLSIAALAGCGDGSSTPAPTKSIKGTTEYVDKLNALSELNRGLALRRAIQDSGNRCKRVETSGFQQDYQNLSMWTARCSDTKDWALFIAPNADVQVRKCVEMQRLKLPACRIGEGS